MAPFGSHWKLPRQLLPKTSYFKHPSYGSVILQLIYVLKIIFWSILRWPNYKAPTAGWIEEPSRSKGRPKQIGRVYQSAWNKRLSWDLPKICPFLLKKDWGTLPPDNDSTLSFAKLHFSWQRFVKNCQNAKSDVNIDKISFLQNSNLHIQDEYTGWHVCSGTKIVTVYTNMQFVFYLMQPFLLEWKNWFLHTETVDYSFLDLQRKENLLDNWN